MSEKTAALLKAYIMSDASPDGKWWIDIPAGLSLDNMETYPTVSAVCLTDREQELPEVYPEHTGVPYVYNREDEAVGVTKSDMFEAVCERGRFSDESAVVFGVETGSSTIETVGNILAYEQLVAADWNWDIEERVLVSDIDTPAVNYVCDQLDIRAVRVATNSSD
jgi:hypothetical protein